MESIMFFLGLFLGGIMVYFSSLNQYRQAKFYKNKYQKLYDEYERLLNAYGNLQDIIIECEKRFGVKL